MPQEWWRIHREGDGDWLSEADKGSLKESQRRPPN